MYGTDPSRCRPRQLFLLLYASTDNDPPYGELSVGLKTPPPLPERLSKLGFFQILNNHRPNCNDLGDVGSDPCSIGADGLIQPLLEAMGEPLQENRIEIKVWTRRYKWSGRGDTIC
ncbi:hypothetical protein NE237_015009 [Protea cynaroides]|uniref:Uncharacterized protein n=1 Tax=Protea cynaroides TaxID=273540 RepID=A0A9Q0QQN7_9MAGN|nr:hypothetical protein NE237_015009 [Protea cynaroides]